VLKKNTFDFCVHPYTVATKRKAFKHVYFLHNLAKTLTAGRVIFLAKGPAQIAPLKAHWRSVVKSWYMVFAFVC
jgi:hypothetical protein